MALRPVLVDKRSPFLGEACALCKQPFGPGDELVVCPEDATRHHVYCWRAHGDKCTAYGCEGRGEVLTDARIVSGGLRNRRGEDRSEAKVQTLPARGFHCAQSCLLIAIAVAIILFAIGCFGLWAIADYIVTELLGWQYRAPVAGLFQGIDLPTIQHSLAVLGRAIH
jgi:hypothetical protein